jgi:hypothetical protein
MQVGNKTAVTIDRTMDDKLVPGTTIIQL